MSDAVKMIVSIAIIVVALAVIIWYLLTNYNSVTSQFYLYLGSAFSNMFWKP